MANTKWEYYQLQSPHDFTLDVIKNFGEDGWELITVRDKEETTDYIFKRPIVDSVLSGIMQADRRLLEAYESWKKSHTIWCHGRSQKEAINKFLTSNGA